MTGFEPRTSDIGSDRSTNWATTTAHKKSWFIVLWFGLLEECLLHNDGLWNRLMLPQQEDAKNELKSDRERPYSK